MKRKALLAVTAGAILLIGVTAGAGVYLMDAQDETQAETTVKTTSTSGEKVIFDEPRQEAQQRPACDDDNIVGKVAGGVAGGVAGSQFGKGSGKTATTIGGTIGGSLLGEEYLPTDGVTCPK